MITNVFEYNQHFVAMMNIINAARLNPPERGHKHHIIPRCWFKKNNLPVDNSDDNLVLLSYEDHVKVHRLSILCVKDKDMKSKMAYAVHVLHGGSITGIHHTAESKRKMSKAHKGLTHSEDTRNKIAESCKGRKNSEESKRKMAQAMKGKYKGMKWKVVNNKRVWYKVEE